MKHRTSASALVENSPLKSMAPWAPEIAPRLVVAIATEMPMDSTLSATVVTAATQVTRSLPRKMSRRFTGSESRLSSVPRSRSPASRSSAGMKAPLAAKITSISGSRFDSWVATASDTGATPTTFLASGSAIEGGWCAALQARADQALALVVERRVHRRGDLLGMVVGVVQQHHVALDILVVLQAHHGGGGVQAPQAGQRLRARGDLGPEARGLPQLGRDAGELRGGDPIGDMGDERQRPARLSNPAMGGHTPRAELVEHALRHRHRQHQRGLLLLHARVSCQICSPNSVISGSSRKGSSTLTNSVRRSRRISMPSLRKTCSTWRRFMPVLPRRLRSGCGPRPRRQGRCRARRAGRRAPARRRAGSTGDPRRARPRVGCGWR